MSSDSLVGSMLIERLLQLWPLAIVVLGRVVVVARWQSLEAALSFGKRLQLLRVRGVRPPEFTVLVWGVFATSYSLFEPFHLHWPQNSNLSGLVAATFVADLAVLVAIYSVEAATCEIASRRGRIESSRWSPSFGGLVIALTVVVDRLFPAAVAGILEAFMIGQQCRPHAG